MVHQAQSEIGDASGRVSGRWVACGILGLGLISISTLWLYTDLHTAPFLELRDAIHSEFASSAPQVEGGQRKIHRGSPKILRVTLRVDWDPLGNDAKVALMMSRLVELAEKHQGLATYDQFDVHLVWFRPEQEAVSRHETRMIQELIEAGLVRSSDD